MQSIPIQRRAVVVIDKVKNQSPGERFAAARIQPSIR